MIRRLTIFALMLVAITAYGNPQQEAMMHKAWGVRVAETGAPTRGLVSYWPFSGNANDAVGSNNGTVVSATLTNGPSGAANTAYYFSGSSYINCGSNTSFNVTNSFSFSIWYKITTLTGWLNDELWFFGKDQASGRSYAWGITYSGAFGLTRCQNIQINGTRAGYNPKANTVDGVWHHAVVTHNGTTVSYYQDGGNLASYTTNAIPAVTTSPFYIGARSYSGNEGYMRGMLSKARLYNVALTSNEVVQIYNAEKP